MTEGKTSDAQVRASRKWEEKNPDRKRYIRYRLMHELLLGTGQMRKICRS